MIWTLRVMPLPLTTSSINSELTSHCSPRELKTKEESKVDTNSKTQMKFTALSSILSEAHSKMLTKAKTLLETYLK